MTQFSCQYACSPTTGDYGPLSVENLAVARLLLGNHDIRDAGVIYWKDSSYVPQVTRTVGGGLSNAVDGLLEPTESSGVVTIDTGVAIVNGYLYLSDETEDFDIDANPGNANATDIIVLQWIGASQTVRLARIAGAAASTAVLTQTTAIWEIPIAEVLLDGSGQFSALTDVRKLAVSPGTLVKLGEYIGDGTNGLASFTNIPPIFTSLIVKGYGRTDLASTTASLLMTFNGDTGLNYSRQVSTFTNSVSASHFTGQGNINTGSFPGTTTPANYFDIIEVNIIGYKNTNGYKASISHSTRVGDGTTGAATGFGQVLVSGWWDNTTIINQVDITVSGAANFITGTNIILYGVV